MKTLTAPATLLLALAFVIAGCARHKGFAPGVQSQGPPQFETRIEINTGTGIHADFHVADLNGDTVYDMAVISLSGELKILLGNATNFVEAQLLQIDGAPIWIDGADFDSDGDRDLVVVRAANGTADVYLNNGSATFTAGASLVVGADALAVVVGDVDDDGDIDIVVSRQVSPEVEVFTGDGLGNFALAQSLVLVGGGVALTVAIGDISRDGLPDLAVSDPVNSRVALFLGNLVDSQIDFLPMIQLDIPGGPRAVSFGDLSGDGHPDLAVSAFSASKLVVVTDIDFSAGTGPVTYSSMDVQLTAAPTLSTIGDVTGDGLDDLVVCQFGHASVAIVPQLPGGGLGGYVQLDSTGLPVRPFIGDFDKNGQNDLFALSGLGNRINLWLADGSGRLVGSRNYDSGLSTASFLGAADFDGDGDIEIAVGDIHGTQISIMERQPDGSLAAVHFVEVGATVMQVHAVDLDLDGKKDLLASVVGGIKTMRNATVGAGYAFDVMPGLAITISSASVPFGVAAADFDGDGDFDLAVCDYGGGAIHVVPGTATPFSYGSELVIPLPGGPADIVAADFTGDGELDLAITRIDMSDIVIMAGDGSGDFQQFLSLPVGTAPNYLITGDFNRDQRADLVVSNGDSGSITVAFGGASAFTTVSYPAGQTPTALLAEDLTGDGIDDILVTSLQSGDFRVLVGDGSGSFPGVFRFPGTLGASDALLQDMDGDGRRDLLIASLISNRVSLVRNIRQ